MFVSLNGELIRETEALVSVFDRGFLYGDGLFETTRIGEKGPEHWPAHYQRLAEGARFLKIPLNLSSEQLRRQSISLLQANRQQRGILRIQLTRGMGSRGYAPPKNCVPLMVMTLHVEAERTRPASWSAILSTQQLDAHSPLNRYKTCNKLQHILAKMEAVESGADEAILTNQSGQLVEGAGSNLFLVTDTEVITPPVSAGALPGVTRSLVIGLCRELKISCREMPIPREALLQAEGAFVTFSTEGIVNLHSLDNAEYQMTPEASRLHSAYLRMRL